MNDLSSSQEKMRKRWEGVREVLPHPLKPKNPTSINRDEVNVASLFKTQGRRCAICKQRIRIKAKDGKIKRVACVDHNHQTGRVRGLLCRSCNFLLGYAYDNRRILQNAILYLEKHNRRGRPLQTSKKTKRIVAQPRSIQLLI